MPLSRTSPYEISGSSPCILSQSTKIPVYVYPTIIGLRKTKTKQSLTVFSYHQFSPSSASCFLRCFHFILPFCWFAFGRLILHRRLVAFPCIVTTSQCYAFCPIPPHVMSLFLSFGVLLSVQGFPLLVVVLLLLRWVAGGLVLFFSYFELPLCNRTIPAW